VSSTFYLFYSKVEIKCKIKSGKNVENSMLEALWGGAGCQRSWAGTARQGLILLYPEQGGPNLMDWRHNIPNTVHVK
jgi:hypothetical protein